MDNTKNIDRDVPILYLIRGLPGAGKTTYANTLGCIVIAPSDYSSWRGGIYKWRRENYMINKLIWRDIVEKLMILQIDIAITELMPEGRFINFWLDLAKKYYYYVKIKTIIVDPEIAIQRNIHQADHKSIYEVHEQFDYNIMDKDIDCSDIGKEIDVDLYN